MTAVVDSDRLVQDLAYVEAHIASSAVLRATNYRVYTHGQQVSVEVEGAHWEARAWRAAFDGRILPSHFDSRHVRHQLVVAAHVEIEVLQHPRGEQGRVNVAVAVIVAAVGLFLWGFAHGSRTPNGAWVAAVAVVGAVVLVLATGIAGYRRREHRAADRGTAASRSLHQDTSGEHIFDGM